MNAAKRTHVVYLFLLLILSAYVWRFIPEQVIRGDGFVYLISKTQREFFGRDFFYTGFELSAVSLGWFFSKLYGINIALYWWTAYIVMLATHALFYWLAITIFKKPIFAFIASVFFATNYFGNWGMYSSHCYCFFLERIIPVLFLLPAAVYLHRFLENRKRRDGIVSLMLYFLGIGVGHWSVFVTAYFFFYPVCWALFLQRGKGIRNWLLGATYVGITIFFVLIQRVHESGFQLKWSPVDFFFHPEVYLWPQKIIRQFVYWTEYPLLIADIFQLKGLQPETDNFRAIEAITPYIMALYILVSYIIFRFFPKYRAFLVTMVFGTISIFYVNALFGQYDVLYQAGANRYLYYPTMFLSLFWTLFIMVLLISRKKLFRIVASLFVAGYVLMNMVLIRDAYLLSMRFNRPTKLVYDYIQTKARGFAKNTLIVAPYDEVGVYEAAFFTEQLKPFGVTVMSEENTFSETSMWERTALSSTNVVRLHYRRSCNCLREVWLKGKE